MLNISTWCIVGLYWVPGHAGVWGNETATKLSRDSSVQNFVGRELYLGLSRQNIKRKIKCCVDNKHLVMWCSLSSTQRQVRKLISGPSLTTKMRFMFFNRTQSRVIIGLLTRHNTLRRHLHLLRLTDIPLCRRCGTEEETSAHNPFDCETLASLRHTYLCSLFLDPEDIKSLSLGVTWNFNQGTGFPWPGIRLWGTKGPF
jgi:hypothetical protein